MPKPDSGLIDTASLTVENLRQLLPVDGPALGERGHLILELVLEDPDEHGELKELLELVMPIADSSAFDYFRLDRPITSFYTAHVDKAGVDELRSAHFRAFTVSEIGVDRRASRRPCWVGRLVFTVSNAAMLIVCWRGASAFPDFPERREDAPQPGRQFPGLLAPSRELEEAKQRGVPDTQARFAHGWGGEGPRAFDTACELFDATETPGPPQAVGEAFVARVSEASRTAAVEFLPSAYRQWEHDLLTNLRESEATVENWPARLAVLGGIAGLVEESLDELSEPFDHAERYWFTRTEDSFTVDNNLSEGAAGLERFNDRLRNALALVSAVTASQALTLQQRTEAQRQGFQTAITVFGALVLGPALVFSLFGANVPLPLASSWWGFGLMLLLSLLSVVGLAWALREASRRHRQLTAVVNPADNPPGGVGT